MTRSARPWPWWRWAMTGLSTVGLALSAYLGWHYLSGGSVVGCGGPTLSGCDQVLKSRWSTIGGMLPVSGLAAGVYLAMLVASLAIGPATDAPVRRLAWSLMLVLVGAAAGSAVWFTILQKWVLGAFCPYCTAAHIAGVLLAVLVIWRAPRQFEEESSDVGFTSPALASDTSSAVPDVAPATPRRLIAPLAALSRAGMGMLLAGALAACQLRFSPAPVYRGGESQQSLPALDPHAVPLVGSPEAQYVLELLFDYKCPHCQQLHFMLNEAIRSYGGKLAFVLCPTPLNRQCNPYIPRDVDEFKDSCKLAKVALAVWVAKHEAFPAFDQWMFSFESGDHWNPRSLDAVKAKALELVGQTKLEAALADPWIDRYMQTSMRIYGDTIQAGNGAIPKLVFGSRWVVPEPNDAHELALILQNSLAVPKP